MKVNRVVFIVEINAQTTEKHRNYSFGRMELKQNGPLFLSTFKGKEYIPITKQTSPGPY